MITGDNLLTAAHVAKAALIAKTPTIRLIEVDDDNRLSSSILSHQRFLGVFVLNRFCFFFLKKRYNFRQHFFQIDCFLDGNCA